MAYEVVGRYGTHNGRVQRARHLPRARSPRSTPWEPWHSSGPPWRCCIPDCIVGYNISCDRLVVCKIPATHIPSKALRWIERHEVPAAFPIPGSSHQGQPFGSRITLSEHLVALRCCILSCRVRKAFWRSGRVKVR